MFACGHTGDVVQVTVVDNGTHLTNHLDEAEIAELEEIQKDQGEPGVDNGFTHVLEESPQLTASEYLQEHPDAQGANGVDYKVGGYDVLSITVYEEADLSRNAVRISADGYISFPLIGRLKVEQLTTSEIEKLIAYRLAEEQYLLDAHVSVMVTDYNSQKFLVLGAVKSPGSYALMAQESVLDAISRAGGLESDQASKKAMLVRTHNSAALGEHKVVIEISLHDLLQRGNQESNLFLVDNDVVYVPRAEHFYIIGQVNNPGSFTVPERQLTLVEALGMAGGFTRIAARNKTRIIRVEEGVEKIIKVKVDAITEAGRKIQDVVIKANDVIVVPESFF